MITQHFQQHLVSVIIPLYNREALIAEAIKSVYEQTYRPIECVVVDDGSIDSSFQTVENLKRSLDAEDFKIISIQQSNAGAPAARNTGLYHAKGELIQFLDSDDLLYADKIRSQVDFLKMNPDVDGVYGDWHHGTTEKHELIKGEKWDDMISQFYGGRVIANFSMLLKRTVVHKIGPWDESLKRNQEIDYFLRGVLAGGKFDYLPQVTGLWREHSGERIVSSSGALSALAFHDKWINEFQRLGLFTKKRQETAAHYLFWHALVLNTEQKDKALNYLYKAYDLYPDFPELNTAKMKLLRNIIGNKLSLKCWYKRTKSKRT